MLEALEAGGGGALLLEAAAQQRAAPPKKMQKTATQPHTQIPRQIMRTIKSIAARAFNASQVVVVPHVDEE